MELQNVNETNVIRSAVDASIYNTHIYTYILYLYIYIYIYIWCLVFYLLKIRHSIFSLKYVAIFNHIVHVETMLLTH